MMVLYHSLVFVCFAAVLPLLPLVWVLSEKRRANLLQRLGLLTGFTNKKPGQFRIWIHALSVGEVTSALPLVQAVRKKRPGAEIIFTASTRTGFQTAHRLLGPESGDIGLKIGYFPFDLWFAVQRVLSRVNPDLVILVETDLWPGFLSITARQKIPVVLVNARLSSAAHRGYCRLKWIFGRMFATLFHVTAQTLEDAERLVDAGVRRDRISVAGNIKFDRPMVKMNTGAIQEIRTDLGLGPDQAAWIAGSTHQGEEPMVAKAFNRLRPQFKDLKLVIAPRDPGRALELVRELGFGAYQTACLSDSFEKKAESDILVIDRLGGLISAYAAGSVAFVGGSLVDQGGHNPLEPAMFGKPVFFGPHMEDFYEVARMLVTAGGAHQVDSPERLAKEIERILENRDLMAQAGQAAKQVVLDNSGAVDRTLEIIKDKALV